MKDLFKYLQFLLLNLTIRYQKIKVFDFFLHF
jgi:hypothetical protein